MNAQEYLLSYGVSGDFGRFRADQPLPLRRGERAVVRSHRGVEIAEVLRIADTGVAKFLPNTTVGALLRRATAADTMAAAEARQRAARLLDRAGALLRTLQLPVELLDAEVLLEGQRGILHLVRFDECDVRPFVSGLSRESDLEIELADLTASESPPHDHGGCGSCGEGGGGCGSCGGGNCGTCASVEPRVIADYLADVRQQADGRHALL